MAEPKSGQNQRISVSLNRKFGLPNYSSIDVHVGYSADVEEGEKPDEAFKRIAKQNLDWFEMLCKKMNTGEKPKGG